MNPQHITQSDHPTSHATLGLPFWAIVALALLAVPRVVLHDLELITSGSLVNGLFVFVPPLIWIAVVLWRRVPTPFVSLLLVGLVYGVLLALGHQLLWGVSFGDNPPRLGGNLTDLDPTVQSAIIRFFAVISSIFTGVIVGAISGLVAWGLQTVMRSRS